MTKKKVAEKIINQATNGLETTKELQETQPLKEIKVRLCHKGKLAELVERVGLAWLASVGQAAKLLVNQGKTEVQRDLNFK